MNTRNPQNRKFLEKSLSCLASGNPAFIRQGTLPCCEALHLRLFNFFCHSLPAAADLPYESLLLQNLPLELRERGILRTLVLRQAVCGPFSLVQETFYLYLNERIVSLQILRISLCIITIISPCRKINGAIREKERPPLRRYFPRAKPGPFSQFLHAKKSLRR